ncbi:coagulation factor XI-like [Mugil cephalus]|uniref:coagulation factor XI-like n=1 Tax=Mugil cephalus TaxID=48193 RepID=UPI001FB722B6|nr:coagulation factor XI-like [Mugil cephalus]
MVTRLVGLLFLCSLSFSQECNRDLLENIDYPGGDIMFLYAPDVEYCQRLCTQHPACLFFTFIRADWTQDNSHFYCYLKSNPTPARKPLLGVTSGESLKHCPPDLNPCQVEVYQNVDFKGADYRALFTADYQECQRACTHDPGCRFFTFLKVDFTPERYRYKCHLKFSSDVPRPPTVERKTGVTSGFSHRLQITQDFHPTCESKLFLSTDSPGNDIEKLPSPSPELCQTLCSAHPLCTYYSYISPDLSCYLKNNPNEMVIRSKEGSTSGFPARFCQPDKNWITVAHEGIDFTGSDIRFELLSDAESCQRNCTDDHNCQFYTYVDENFSVREYRGRCYLKRVISVPIIPEVTKLSTAVSGFSLRNCAA